MARPAQHGGTTVKPIAILVVLPILLSFSPAFAQTTTHTAATANNTAACDGIASPGAYCSGPFSGLSSSTSGTYVPAPGHISNVPIRNALYAGSTTKLF